MTTALKHDAITGEDLNKEASFLAAKEVADVLVMEHIKGSTPFDGIMKGVECVELFKKAEPHRGTDAGAVAGMVAGGVGGSAIATVLVFPPLIPLVILGGFLGFKWGATKT